MVVIFVLGACGYVREPAKGPASDLAAPQPAWPSNYTNFKPMRIRVPVQRVQSKPGAPVLMMSIAGEPIGQGWITWNGDVVNPIQSHGGFEFGYSAWRTEPKELHSLHDPFDRVQYILRQSDFKIGFSFWMPALAEPKGMVIYQWGVGGERYERRLVSKLVRGGWAVLAYDYLSFGSPGRWTVPADRWSAEGATGSESASRRLASSKAAATVARYVDEWLGQYALGVEAALIHVRRHFPSVNDKPLTVVGCSLGSLLLPALATRLGDNIDACVMVGSGVNILQIAGRAWQNEAYSLVRTGNATTVVVPAAERKHMLDEYLRHSTLDPYHAAPALRRVPTLMLHARWDAIVPASGGRTLWERAGRPERWTGNFGHLWMFLTLDDVADDIVAWIEQTATPPVAATGD